MVARRVIWSRMFFLFFSFFLLGFFTYPAASYNAITDLRYSSDLERFRVVFEFEDRIDYHLFYIGSPSRVVVDLTHTSFTLGEQRLTFSDPSVTSIQVTTLGEDVQAVIHLTENITNFHGFTLEEPHRLVVDITRDLEYERDFQVLVAPGLYYRHIHRRGILEPLLMNILEVDLTPGSSVQVTPVLAQDRIIDGEEVSSMSQRFQALAGVNGTFFDGSHRPLGMLLIQGFLVSEPILNRTVLGILEDGSLMMDRVEASIQVQTPTGVIPVDGLNRPPRDGEVVLYNHQYGLRIPQQGYTGFVIRGGRVIKEAAPGEILPTDGYILLGHGAGGLYLVEKLRPGTWIEMAITYQPSHWNTGVLHAIGGGPRLIQNGEIHITAVEEHFRPDVVMGRAPRTALGITERGRLLIVTVSGRSEYSIGMTLEELAQLMQDLGAVEAMNLDGGGSTTMVLRQRIFNLPSSGEERKVSNALLVLPND